MKLGALLLKSFRASKLKNTWAKRTKLSRQVRGKNTSRTKIFERKVSASSGNSKSGIERTGSARSAIGRVGVRQAANGLEPSEHIPTNVRDYPRAKSEKLSKAREKIQLASVLNSPAAHPSIGASDFTRPDGQMKKSIESFLLDQRSPHTRTAYGRDLNRFVKYLILRKSSGRTDAVDRSVIIGYKDHLLAEKLNHTTIDRHLATLKSFFGWLTEDGVIDRNFAENVKFLNPKRESSTKGFTDEEVGKILALPDLYTKTGSLHYAILMILFYCGLRRSELCELRTSSIGFERGHHYLKLRGKGNSERIVVMTDAVWKSVQHYLRITRKKQNVDQALFSPVKNNRTFLRDKPLDSSMIFYIVTRYAKVSGIKHKVSPHSCRATAISNARDHQVPDRAIQEFAGWASPLMITRYDKRKSALEKSAVHAISYGNQNREIPSERLIESDLKVRAR